MSSTPSRVTIKWLLQGYHKELYTFCLTFTLTWPWPWCGFYILDALPDTDWHWSKCNTGRLLWRVVACCKLYTYCRWLSGWAVEGSNQDQSEFVGSRQCDLGTRRWKEFAHSISWLKIDQTSARFVRFFVSLWFRKIVTTVDVFIISLLFLFLVFCCWIAGRWLSSFQ